MIIEVLTAAVGEILGDIFGNALQRTLSKRELDRNLANAVERAHDRFIKEYSEHDHELVSILTQQTHFGDLPSVQAALQELLTRPFHDPSNSINVIELSFDDVLPSNFDRRRVNSAVSAFLSLIGQEVLYIPQLQQMYALLFQKTSAEYSKTIASNTAKIAESILGIQANFRQLPQFLISTASPTLPSADERPQERLFPWNNLPKRTYSQFVGRESELQKIIQLMLPYPRSRHFLVTIDGIGGVGKSALALELGHFYQEQYEVLPTEERFHAIIWVCAKRDILTASGIQSRHQTFTNLKDLYREIAIVLDETEILRASYEQQKILITLALSRHRALLIVDNLETVDDEEVITFLRELPDPTKVIITTRHRIDIAYTVRLMGMPRSDAIELIKIETDTKGVDLMPEVVEELYEKTGGIPLAIVWSLGLLGLGYRERSVLDQLSNGQTDITRFCFKESLKRIDKEYAYRLLTSLALFDASVNRVMIGNVAGTPNEYIRDDGLAKLLQLSLISQEGNRFSLLPLTRHFVLDELSGSPELEPNLRNSWSQELIILAAPFAEIGWRWHDMSELRQEGQHLISLASWAESSERIDILLRIVSALCFYYDLTGQWNERLIVTQTGIKYARLAGSNKVLFMMLREAAGGVLSQQGLHQEAEDSIQEAYKVALDAGEIGWQCKALLSYSAILRRVQLFDRAYSLCQQVSELVKELPIGIQRQAQASLEYELGKLARDRQDWLTAQKHFIAARDAFGYESENSEFDVGRAWGVLSNLGTIMHHLNDYEAAEKIYLQCLDHSRKSGSGKGSITTLFVRLAELYEDRNNYDLAIEYAREAFEWSKRLRMAQENRLAKEICERLEVKIIQHPDKESLSPTNNSDVT